MVASVAAWHAPQHATLGSLNNLDGAGISQLAYSTAPSLEDAEHICAGPCCEKSEVDESLKHGQIMTIAAFCAHI